MADPQLLALERKVAESPGDQQAAAALGRFRARAGRCPKCGGVGVQAYRPDDADAGLVCCCMKCFNDRPEDVGPCSNCPYGRDTP